MAQDDSKITLSFDVTTEPGSIRLVENTGKVVTDFGRAAEFTADKTNEVAATMAIVKDAVPGMIAGLDRAKHTFLDMEKGARGLNESGLELVKDNVTAIRKELGFMGVNFQTLREMHGIIKDIRFSSMLSGSAIGGVTARVQTLLRNVNWVLFPLRELNTQLAITDRYSGIKLPIEFRKDGSLRFPEVQTRTKEATGMGLSFREKQNREEYFKKIGQRLADDKSYEQERKFWVNTLRNQIAIETSRKKSSEIAKERGSDPGFQKLLGLFGTGSFISGRELFTSPQFTKIRQAFNQGYKQYERLVNDLQKTPKGKEVVELFEKYIPGLEAGEYGGNKMIWRNKGSFLSPLGDNKSRRYQFLGIEDMVPANQLFDADTVLGQLLTLRRTSTQRRTARQISLIDDYYKKLRKTEQGRETLEFFDKYHHLAPTDQLIPNRMGIVQKSSSPVAKVLANPVESKGTVERVVGGMKSPLWLSDYERTGEFRDFIVIEPRRTEKLERLLANAKTPLERGALLSDVSMYKPFVSSAFSEKRSMKDYSVIRKTSEDLPSNNVAKILASQYPFVAGKHSEILLSQLDKHGKARIRNIMSEMIPEMREFELRRSAPLTPPIDKPQLTQQIRASKMPSGELVFRSAQNMEVPDRFRGDPEIKGLLREIDNLNRQSQRRVELLEEDKLTRDELVGSLRKIMEDVDYIDPFSNNIRTRENAAKLIMSLLGMRDRILRMEREGISSVIKVGGIIIDSQPRSDNDMPKRFRLIGRGEVDPKRIADEVLEPPEYIEVKRQAEAFDEGFSGRRRWEKEIN